MRSQQYVWMERDLRVKHSIGMRALAKSGAWIWLCDSAKKNDLYEPDRTEIYLGSGVKILRYDEHHFCSDMHTEMHMRTITEIG